MNEKRTIQFQIVGISRVQPTQVTVEGRCCAEDIYLQDVFTGVFQQIWRKDADGFSHLSELQLEAKITATVIRICGVRPDFLVSGEAGTLVLEVHNPEPIYTDRMLVGENAK